MLLRPVAPRAQDPSSRAAALAVWAALIVTTYLVFAITGPVARLARGSLNPWHHYEYLTEGFRQGHTYLSLDPPKELLELKDPYLPTSLPEKRLWDASLTREGTTSTLDPPPRWPSCCPGGS